MTRPATLYRLLDAQGELLYVGISLDLTGRIPSHREKPWWLEVSGATVAHFPDLTSARREESRAIREELPRYNVAGIPHPPRTREAQRRQVSRRIEKRLENLAYRALTRALEVEALDLIERIP